MWHHRGAQSPEMLFPDCGGVYMTEGHRPAGKRHRSSQGEKGWCNHSKIMKDSAARTGRGGSLLGGELRATCTAVPSTRYPVHITPSCLPPPLTPGAGFAFQCQVDTREFGILASPWRFPWEAFEGQKYISKTLHGTRIQVMWIKDFSR
jgi:hypothetical protein